MNRNGLGTLNIKQEFQVCVNACTTGQKYLGYDLHAYKHDIHACIKKFCQDTYDLNRPYFEQTCKHIKTLERALFQGTILGLHYKYRITTGLTFMASRLLKGTYQAYCVEQAQSLFSLIVGSPQEFVQEAQQVISTLAYNVLSKNIHDYNQKLGRQLKQSERELSDVKKQQPPNVQIDLQEVKGETRRALRRNLASAYHHNEHWASVRDISQAVLNEKKAKVSSLRIKAPIFKAVETILFPIWVGTNLFLITQRLSNSTTEDMSPKVNLSELATKLNIPYGPFVTLDATLLALDKRIRALIDCNIQFVNKHFKVPFIQFFTLFEDPNSRPTFKALTNVLRSFSDMEKNVINIPNNFDLGSCREIKQGKNVPDDVQQSADLMSFTVGLSSETSTLNQHKVNMILDGIRLEGSEAASKYLQLAEKLILIMKSPKLIQLVLRQETAKTIFAQMPELKTFHNTIKRLKK